MFSLRSVLRGPSGAARARSNFTSRYFGHLPGLEVLEERRLLSATATVALLDDIGVRGNANLSDSAEIDGILYFPGSTNDFGEELWRTDGTPAGTYLVRDINPSTTTSSPRMLTNVEGTLYFIALNATTTAFDLWKSDGTEDGTQLVSALSAPLGGPGIQSLTNAGGSLFFVNSAPTHGKELWTSDGTELGTTLVKDIAPGVASAGIDSVTVVDGQLFFCANDGSSGRELWTSDGTEEGTTLVKDIAPGSSDSNPRELIDRDGVLLFTADDGVSGVELWISDGTDLGTTLVADINPTSASNPEGLTVVGPTTFFWADDGAHGKQLWKTDGTELGTTFVSSVNPPDLPSGPMINVNGTLFFVSQRAEYQTELWKSDGTDAGTIPVRPEFSVEAAYPATLTNVGGVLYFLGRRAANGSAMWRSDGSEAGTVPVDDGQVTQIRALNGSVLFSSQIGTGATELWVSDWFGEEKQLLKDVISGDSNPLNFTAVGAQTFFFVPPSVTLDSKRWGLWVSDATTDSARQLKQLRGNADHATNVNGTLFFTVEGTQRDELWSSDGTIAGTSLVRQFEKHVQKNWALTNVAGTLFFVADDGVHGNELWKSDGTAAGTVMVKDNTTSGSSPAELLAVGRVVYFRADSPGFAFQLWRSDGTPDGTFPLTTLPTDNYTISSLIHVDGVIYFADSTALYKTDGTVGGTSFVANVRPVYSVGSNGMLYFTTLTSDRQMTLLWKSDGTPEGTTTIATLAGRIAEPPVVFKDAIFAVTRNTSTNQLWRVGTDGSDLTLLNGVGSGIEHVLTPSLTVVGGTLYFVANDGIRGTELWSSDGTANGTHIVRDIRPGELSSDPGQLTNANGLLYFSAFTEASGSEPWILAPPVVARLFYNSSALDQVAGSTVDDNDAALAVDKLPHLPGNGRSTSENVSSYSKGINGLFVDLAPGHGEITAEDFAFRMGTGPDAAVWTTAPPPLSITVRAGAGIAGHDRVEIVFADGAIKNTWLEITVRGNDARGGFHANTGLDDSSVFYFGSRVGDTFLGNTETAAVTSAQDMIQIRGQAGSSAAAANNRFDIDRNGWITAADEVLARNNAGLLRMLDLPNLSVDSPSQALVDTATRPMVNPLLTSALVAIAANQTDQVGLSSGDSTAPVSDRLDSLDASDRLATKSIQHEPMAMIATDEAVIVLAEEFAGENSEPDDNEPLIEALLLP